MRAASGLGHLLGKGTLSYMPLSWGGIKQLPFSRVLIDSIYLRVLRDVLDKEDAIHYTCHSIIVTADHTSRHAGVVSSSSALTAAVVSPSCGLFSPMLPL